MNTQNNVENLLSKYFVTVVELDSKAEEIRKELSSSNDYNPRTLFAKLDIDNKDFLSLNDFKSFLNSKFVSYSEQTLRKFIHNFDRDNDFAINFSEFVKILQPHHNYSNPNYDSDSAPSDKIESIFTELLRHELQFVEQLASIANELKMSKDFTTYEAFVAVAGADVKHIEAENIRKFCKGNLSSEEIADILFRLDKDGDGMVSYEEFLEIFFPFKSSRKSDSNINLSSSTNYNYTNSFKKSDEFASNDQYRTYKSNFNESKYEFGSPINKGETKPNFYSTVNSVDQGRLSPMNEEIKFKATLNTYTSPKRESRSPLRESSSHLSRSGYYSPRRHENLTWRYRSPLRYTSPNRTFHHVHSCSLSPLRRRHLHDCYVHKPEVHHIHCSPTKKENNYFALTKFFNHLISQESLTESHRESLSLKSDANLDHLFAFFDYSNRNSISLLDMKEALIELGVCSSLDELRLLFKRYDLDMDGRLDFNEFCSMVEPRKFEYNKIIRGRLPVLTCCEGFSCDTLRILASLFKSMIDGEADSELQRKILSSSYGFSSYQCFEMIKDRRNYSIRKEDLSLFLKENGSYASAFELDLLFNRMDRNRDGEITFNEFISEVIPKCNSLA